jgi:conserved oligomeric Golgi complex subunit 3
LETLCDYLYDDLRPRILHEPRLTVLCEVCTVLQALMVLDQSLDDETEDGEKDNEFGRLHIRQLLQMVLQDAQTRLFFKAQAVIQSEIRYYVPTAQDLAYPDKLVGGSAFTFSVSSCPPEDGYSRTRNSNTIRKSREGEYQSPVRGSRA